MLEVYTLEQRKQWDEIVRRFKNYDVYWLNGYVKAFWIHGDGEPLLFHYEDKTVRGIHVVMKRDIAIDEKFSGIIPQNQYFDFITPYGYGGWLIEGENANTLFTAYHKWVLENEIVSEFVRFHPLIKNHESCSNFYKISQLGQVVHMDLSSEDVIWANISSKNRNMIRKAIKNDIVIYNGRFPEIYKKFMEMYNQTMQRDDADTYYYFSKEFYDSVLYDLARHAHIFYAKKDEIIIAAAIILFTNGRMNYHLSGSLKEYNSLAPTNLLLYETALWGYENGYKTFYLGGGVGAEEDGLLKFKQSFYRGRLNHFYIGTQIYNLSRYNELLQKRGIKIDGASKRTYFPKYRAKEA